MKGRSILITFSEKSNNSFGFIDSSRMMDNQAVRILRGTKISIGC